MQAIARIGPGLRRSASGGFCAGCCPQDPGGPDLSCLLLWGSSDFFFPDCYSGPSVWGGPASECQCTTTLTVEETITYEFDRENKQFPGVTDDSRRFHYLASMSHTGSWRCNGNGQAQFLGETFDRPQGSVGTDTASITFYCGPNAHPSVANQSQSYSLSADVFVINDPFLDVRRNGSYPTLPGDFNNAFQTQIGPYTPATFRNCIDGVTINVSRPFNTFVDGPEYLNAGNPICGGTLTENEGAVSRSVTWSASHTPTLSQSSYRADYSRDLSSNGITSEIAGSLEVTVTSTFSGFVTTDDPNAPPPSPAMGGPAGRGAGGLALASNRGQRRTRNVGKFGAIPEGFDPRDPANYTGCGCAPDAARSEREMRQFGERLRGRPSIG